MRSQPSLRRGSASLLGAILCFASVPLFLRHLAGNPHLDAWTINGIRYAFGAAVWTPFVVYGVARGTIQPRLWRDALAPAAVNALGQIGWAVAAYHSEAAVISFVIRSSFVFTALFGALLIAEERKLLQRSAFWWAAGGIATGVVLMAWPACRRGGSSPFGVLLLVITAAFWGLYAVFVRRNMADHSARAGFGVISLYTTLALWITMAAFGDVKAVRLLSPQTWAMLVGSALAGIAFSHILMYRAIHSLGPVVTQGGMTVQPFITTVGALLLLQEEMAWLQWLGGGILATSCLGLVLIKLRIPPPVPVAPEKPPPCGDAHTGTDA